MTATLTHTVTQDDALAGLQEFCKTGGKGYFRFRVDASTVLSSNFNQKVYDMIGAYDDEVRFNPKIVWVGEAKAETASEKPVFEVAELQQMEDPLDFIEKTRNQYAGLPDPDELRSIFTEIVDEIHRFKDEAEQKKAQKAAGKKSKEESGQEE